jgi:glycosyltransferase involved in cell wall biosynthesis
MNGAQATAGRNARPRVAMFVSPAVTFEHDWADAAASVSDLIRIETVDALAWPALRDCPVLARNPDDSTWYQLLRGPKLPWRLLGSLSDLPAVYRTVRALQRLEEEHGPIDLLHAHFYPSARFFPRVKRRLGTPYVVTEHSTALTLESPDKVVTKRGVRIARTVYREAAAVIPVSRSLLGAIRRLGLEGHFVVVSNPVDPVLFQPRHRPVSPDRVDLATVVRLARVKGIDVLLEALALCRERDPRLHLTVAGSGPLEDELRELASNLGVGEAVSFVGRLDRNQVARLLARSDVFVLPSRTENLPVSIIEALMSGLPIVATRVGGVPELVPEGRGRLVQKEDVLGLAEALLATIAELPQHDRVASAEDARRKYSFEATGRALAEIYEEARNGNGERRAPAPDPSGR